MLPKEINEKLTRVGPGTPMGNLLRRYWHPIAASVELQENPVKKVRLMCEDLVLYRDRSGNLGLIDEPCPHRRVSMEYGIPEQEGLRCPYHGWLFNHEGRCLEQPAEPWDSTFKDRVTTKSYPVQDFAGMIWAYLGPQPAPLLPRYDLFVWDNAVRHIGATMLPCNWIQCMENSLDPVHVEWLHGRFMDYVYERRGQDIGRVQARGKHKKIGFDRFEHGLIKRRVSEGGSEEDPAWRIGHPVIFPNILRVGSNGNWGHQYRVPVDDDHTWHVRYTTYTPDVPVPPQDTIPLYEIPMYDENGKFGVDVLLVQDFFAWASQGPIARRDLEHLGQSDIGVIMYRDLLLEMIDRVERGEEPMEIYRDPALNQVIDIPQEQQGRRTGFTDGALACSEAKFSPIVHDIIGLFQQEAARAERGEPLLPRRTGPIVLPGSQGPKREVDILP